MAFQVYDPGLSSSCCNFFQVPVGVPHLAWSFSWFSSLPGCRSDVNQHPTATLEDSSPRIASIPRQPVILASFLRSKIKTSKGLPLTRDTSHRASDRCLNFFRGQSALGVLVILLQIVNHCLRIAEYTEAPAASDIHGSSVVLTGLNSLEILYQFILHHAAALQSGNIGKIERNLKVGQTANTLQFHIQKNVIKLRLSWNQSRTTSP